MSHRPQSSEGSAESIPVSYYTDSKHFTLERDRVLFANWVAVARVEDLAQPGDYLTVFYAGEPILVTHSLDGELLAFSNVCRHRLTTLAQGCGNARSLQCPYHLWTYDLAGRLIGSPGMEDAEGFRRGDWGLKELGLDTWGGWVFVHLDKQARPLLEQIPHLDTTYSGAYLERLVRVGRSTCPSPLNWKVLVENFVESYHHAGVHPTSLQTPFPYQNVYEVDNFGEAWSAIEHPPAIEGAEPLAVVTVFPTLLFAINRPFAMFWFQLNILGHDRAELDMQSFVPPEFADNEELAKALVEGNVSVNNEDFAINERTWQGMHSHDATMGPLSRYEEGVKRFRQWLLEALADSDPRSD
jgi:phenylpropionate dioxygenase-like ring-hydroxylating dioxygenase large terminal subunit